MIWNRWRQRLTYLAMSGFLAWHTIAMMIAPAPYSSVSVQTLRTAFQPYLTFFRLDNPWNFFAPTVAGTGLQLHYVIVDAEGAHHDFSPTERLNRLHPNFIWFRSWHYAIFDNPELYADRAAVLLCRQHAALRPVSITFLVYHEEAFTPEDHLNAKHPMDPEFITVNTVKSVQCPAR
jgi:hypothetical protein